eukprot:CAMPEP_0206449896 /NCGR_PEP_ID=MMETSP0324_2-20121206/18383_1 /ASSEMBLY_ACC=CAM_ASM_000836 /TAXON_ID=2866 /ORGANISM="Crypthecodinium cohnii, Strain Seligo" /LENGTH=331 /DNA_ID=CAMNT_0053919403 /DNA_START=35 /DNA_END=1030 /DNA_ORIENTATION=-
MGKKPVAKTKAKAKAAPEPEEAAPTPEQLEAKRLWQQRREAAKWAQAQLEVVRGQLAAAQKKGQCDWLQVAHEFHEIRLIRLQKSLDAKEVEGASQALRDGLQAYLAQCASGPDVEQDKFEKHQGIWADYEASTAGYQRPAETEEAAAAIEKIKGLAIEKEADVTTLVDTMKAFEGSAGVQEACLIRIGGALAKLQKDGEEVPGFDVKGLLPPLAIGMRLHLQDAGVQKSGMAALRGLALAKGQLGFLRDGGGIEVAVESLHAQYKEKEVAEAANGAFSAMASNAGRNSPEVATMRTAGVVEVLLKVMDHHAWDQTLCGKVRVTLPFITED